MITNIQDQTQQHQVIEMLKKSKGFTSREIAERFKQDKYMIARRLSDLKNVSVKIIGLRKCRVTKQACLTWGLM